MTGYDEVLDRIQRYLVGISELESSAERYGPFSAYFSTVTVEDWGSYALPTGPLTSGWQDRIEEVESAFDSRGRRTQWELVVELYPELPDELRRRGFTSGDIEPLLVLDAPLVAPEGAAVDLVRIEPDEPALKDILAIAHHAFEEEGVVTDRRVTEKRDELRVPYKEMVAGAAEGSFVASGVVTRFEDVAEITAIATRPEFRSRGIASAVTAELVRIATEAGAELVYLTARDAAAGRIYERLGFRRVGTYMELERPKA